MNLRNAARRAKMALQSLRADQEVVHGLTAVDRDQWERRAQEGEYNFHRKNKWRQTSDFDRQTRALFEHFGFGPMDYTNRTVMDVGAGSKLRSKYFKGAHLIALEPLADRFMADLEWSDLRDASVVYSRPAEERIEEIVGTVDLVVSINVLDHCFDMPTILGNLRAYLRPGSGLAFLSFDKHAKADAMHPLSLTEESTAELIASQGLFIEKFTTGMGDALGGPQTYGHGPYTLNYWLRACE